MSEDALPAWGLEREAALAARLRSPFPLQDPRDWAFGGSTGAGVRVCVIDSGIDATHPRVGAVARAVCFEPGDDEQRRVVEDTEGDSVRTLGRDLTGAGAVLLAGLEWAIDEGYDTINLSLSTTKSQFVPDLHALADRAYFANTLIFAAAHNMPVASYPWRFPAVVSVGSHSGTDPHEVYASPEPPAEFLARGVNVELAYPAVQATAGRICSSPQVRDLYPVFLATMHGVVRSAVPLMEAALERCRTLDDPVATALVPYFEHHAPEEAGHDVWLLEDLEALGGDPDAALAAIPSARVRDARGRAVATGFATSTRSRCSGTWRWSRATRPTSASPTACTLASIRAKLDEEPGVAGHAMTRAADGNFIW